MKMASNLNTSKIPIQETSKSPQHQHKMPAFEPLDKPSNTLKRNPKMELGKSDLLKLLSYLEGELQARDIVIATLKCERVKQLLNQGRYQPLLLNDPHAALQRDSFASAESRVDEAEIRSIANQQMASLENLVLQYRRGQMRLSRILRDAEERHKKELELEKQKNKKLEKDLKKVSDILEDERSRQKQIVLLLLAERKKIIMKYVEERKRSEDLAQILTEEKTRIDTMAEGLEEESKKSLQMEAELEKQFVQFDLERQELKSAVSKEESRYKDLLGELEKARAEADSLKKQLAEAHQVAMFQAGTASMSPPRVSVGLPKAAMTLIPPQPPVKPSVVTSQGMPRISGTALQQAPTGMSKVSGWAPLSPRPDGSMSPPPGAGLPMMSSVAKVVQPTATVSSVPVSGPTTGIARSVSPGQGLRSLVYSPTTTPTAATTWGHSSHSTSAPSTEQVAEKRSHLQLQQQPQQQQQSSPPPSQQQASQVVQVTPRVSLSASPGTKVFTTSQGGKVTFHVTANMGGSESPQQLLKKPAPPGRGVPPPIPPNKPVVPPKKEAVVARRPEATPPFEAVKATAGVKLGMALSKGPLQGGDPQVGEGLPVAAPASLHDDPAHAPAAYGHGQGFDMLGPELADFQQLFVSMAAGSPVIAASTKFSSLTSAASSLGDSTSLCIKEEICDGSSLPIDDAGPILGEPAGVDVASFCKQPSEEAAGTDSGNHTCLPAKEEMAK
ncbi:CTTNBP2 N-terminal-like protein isoform X2 [Bacillus rossius redtenbacheri]|uniref:CTTNBP2 N-terminal-like protein isoform X2 n=1 Tax=Bacillus rossius redtenbacheri TaxID=93214 RepID=UPI002FDD1613